MILTPYRGSHDLDPGPDLVPDLDPDPNPNPDPDAGPNPDPDPDPDLAQGAPYLHLPFSMISL